ncbi:DUF4279 domain-containing protein [Nocardia cyriacigeorgica]|uniref:DUF4279 domain-containing protein n=1 Tax=Nocardia cyriacigeorgica TaxID=135487 RepID=UPI0018958D42|nr:DUF4279 domain-containing protein [Nocardia cyriacigeorgica]
MPAEWTSPNSVLVVTREDLDPHEISRRLGMKPTIALAPDKSRSFKNGAGLWSVAASEGTGTSTGAQIEALSSSILPVRPQLEALGQEGYSIELLIIGHVSGVHQIHISPNIFRSLQILDLPVAFITRRSASEEDLFWANFDAQI